MPAARCLGSQDGIRETVKAVFQEIHDHHATIRNPPEKGLEHQRGREATKWYNYKCSDFHDRGLQKIQQKHDGYGRKHQERPLD